MWRSNAVIGRYLLCAVLLIPAVAWAQQDATETVRKVTNRVVPLYPKMARSLQVSGVVRLNVLVAPNGTVKSMKVIGGHPLLVQSAEEAVQKWKWEPATHENTELVELRFNPQ